MNRTQQLHKSARVRCPECETKALRPVIDYSKPDGVDASQGFCYGCKKRIGGTQPRMTREQRADELARLYRLSTDKNVHARNGLAVYLQSVYGDGVVDHLRSWDVATDGIGNCVFWYRDVEGELQNAKIIGYDSATGKRRKGQDSPICWQKDGKDTHVDVLYGLVDGRRRDGWPNIVSFSSDRGYSRPLYGAQFVGRTSVDVPVLLVEAEKTAVVVSMFGLPFVVVATGGANGLTRKTASILAGRDVYVALDADDTGRRAGEDVADVLYGVGARPVVDVDGVPLVDYLMPDADKGFDLADYYLSQRDLLPIITKTTTSPPAVIVETADVQPAAMPARRELPTEQVVTAETPQSTGHVDTVRKAAVYENVDGVRSALLRVFGKDSSLLLDELYDRLRTRRIPGGDDVVGAAQFHKLIRLSWNMKSNTYSAVLTEQAI